MASPNAYTEAAVLVRRAAQLLEGDPHAAHLGHLVRVLQAEAKARAVEAPKLPAQRASTILVRQDPDSGACTLIHQETGERREVTLDQLVQAGSAEAAWRAFR